MRPSPNYFGRLLVLLLGILLVHVYLCYNLLLYMFVSVHNHVASRNVLFRVYFMALSICSLGNVLFTVTRWFSGQVRGSWPKWP